MIIEKQCLCNIILLKHFMLDHCFLKLGNSGTLNFWLTTGGGIWSKHEIALTLSSTCSICLIHSIITFCVILYLAILLYIFGSEV